MTSEDGLAWMDSDGDPIFCEVATEDEIWKIAEAAIEMYVFAKIYDIPRLRCDAMDRLAWCYNTAYDFDHCGTFVSASSIEQAYEYTTPGSPLRELLISRFSDFFSSHGEEMIDLPRPYLIDIAENFRAAELSRGELSVVEACNLAVIITSMGWRRRRLSARSGSTWIVRLLVEQQG
jgi:hypothetical protein